MADSELEILYRLEGTRYILYCVQYLRIRRTGTRIEG